MKEYFLKPKEAKALQELGFDEECCKFYKKIGTKTDFSNFTSCKNSGINKHFQGFVCTAPTWEQALGWFEKKHGLAHRRTPTYWNKDDARNGMYEIFVMDLKDIDHVGTKQFKFKDVGYNLVFIEQEPGIDKLFKTAFKANEACIKKMIEIVKSRKK